MGFAELPDGHDAFGNRPAGAHCRFRSIQSDEPAELVPPSARKPTVATARTAAADVLIQDRDPEVGIGLGEEVGGPQAGEPSADDDDIGVGVLGERRAGNARLRGQCVSQPPAQLRSGRERMAGEVQPGDISGRRYRHSLAVRD